MERESVLDLTLATSSIANSIQDWQVLPDLGSDHYGLLFTILGTRRDLVNNPSQSGRFNTKLANWELFLTTLQLNTQNSLVLNSWEFNNLAPSKDDQLKVLKSNESEVSRLLDQVAQELTDLIAESARLSIPRTKIGAKPKPWWNPELKDLRKDIMRQQRVAKSDWDPEAKRSYLRVRGYVRITQDNRFCIEL